MKDYIGKARGAGTIHVERGSVSRIVVSARENTEEGKIVTADVSLLNQYGDVKLSGHPRVVAA